LRDGGRLSAAIAVLEDIETRHKPARLALKNWGESARYAGSKDRAFVSGLVLDGLRKRRSIAARMQSTSSRALAIGVLGLHWGWDVDRLLMAAGEEQHGPGELQPDEIQCLNSDEATVMSPDVAGDFPEWLTPLMSRVFGDNCALEGAALSERAPVDLRANGLKTDALRAAKVLAPLGAQPSPRMATAFRIPAPQASERVGSVETIPAFGKGWFEVQDIGSQIAASCAGEIKGRQVLDYCAGGGGKTLALAALMENTGQLYAYDIDPGRMTDLVPRAVRAGVRNLQVRSALTPDGLESLRNRMDLVFVDAPCTGSGTWRRHPDAKWRLTPEQLAQRLVEQDAVLDQASGFVKPGGRLIYVTCSVFMEENEDRMAIFQSRHPEFKTVPPQDQTAVDFLTPEGFVRLTPLRAETDGFFVAVMERKA
jgi:16S rRNA (cytosine967-C5)-methyltransferase